MGASRNVPLSVFFNGAFDTMNRKKAEVVMAPEIPVSFGDPIYNLSNAFSEMRQQFNGHSGAIGQEFFYFDYESGADWEEVTKDHNYFTVFGQLPFQWITSTLLSQMEDHPSFSQKGITFISLGCGDGNNEIQLICHLLNHLHLKINLHLIDLSHYLLQLAYRQSHRVLARRGVTIYPHESNFYHLPRMPFLFQRPQEEPRELRVGCFFGNTFGNLANEANFIDDSLSAFRKGDLLILHVGLAFAKADRPDLILKEDPRFSAYPGQDLWENWLSGPLVRYRRNLKKIELKSVLDTRSSPIPGSYTINIQATIDDAHHFTLMRIRRYDEDGLVNTFIDKGWKSRGGRLFGEDKKRICYIFEKL